MSKLQLTQLYSFVDVELTLDHAQVVVWKYLGVAYVLECGAILKLSDLTSAMQR
jgi:hypothetical protein